MAENDKPCCAAPDCGIPIIRIGVGICFIFHGWHKVKAGPAFWEQLGNMAHMPHAKIMGTIGAFVEFGGGILLALGLFTRVAASLLFLQMMVAIFCVHLQATGAWRTFDQGYSHALEDAFVFLGLAFLGAGKLSVDRALFKTK